MHRMEQWREGKRNVYCTVGIIHKYTYFPLINLLFVSIFVQITIDTGHLALPIASSKTYKFGYFKQHVHPPARAPCTEAKFSVFMIRGCQVGTRTWDQGARDHLEWNIQAVRAGGGSDMTRKVSLGSPISVSPFPRVILIFR